MCNTIFQCMAVIKSNQHRNFADATFNHSQCFLIPQKYKEY